MWDSADGSRTNHNRCSREQVEILYIPAGAGGSRTESCGTVREQDEKSVLYRPLQAGHGNSANTTEYVKGKTALDR